MEAVVASLTRTRFFKEDRSSQVLSWKFKRRRSRRAKNREEEEKKRGKIARSIRQSRNRRLERLPSNLGRVFRLFFRAPRSRVDTRDIYLLFFAKATPLFRSPRPVLFYRLATNVPLPFSPLLRVSRSRPVSFPSAPAKAGQYIILAVSLFLRTKASSKLEKPRHAHNGRNPGVPRYIPCFCFHRRNPAASLSLLATTADLSSHR